MKEGRDGRTDEGRDRLRETGTDDDGSWREEGRMKNMVA